MDGIADNYNIKQIFGSPFKPQSQRCIEKFNQMLKRMLFAHMTRYRTKVWADVLQTLLDNYNDMVHLSTGYSQNYLHFSQDPVAV